MQITDVERIETNLIDAGGMTTAFGRMIAKLGRLCAAVGTGGF